MKKILLILLALTLISTFTFSQDKLAFSKKLTFEAEKALEEEDIRLAWRLTEEALKNDKENEIADSLKQVIPKYASQYILDGTNLKVSPDSTSIIYFTGKNKSSSKTLNVLEIGKTKPLQFENCIANTYLQKYYFDQYNNYYSPDGKYLTFFTQDDSGKNTILNILEVGKTKPLQFENCQSQRSKEKRKYEYSPDSKYLFFYTKNKKSVEESSTLNVLKIGETKTLQFENCSYAYYIPTEKYLTFSTKDTKGKFSVLNILELGKTKPLQFNNCINFNGHTRYLPDTKIFMFYSYKSEGEKNATPNQLKNSTILNVLELGKTKPYQFEYYKGYRFSPNGKYMTFVREMTDGSKTLKVVNLEKNEIFQFENYYVKYIYKTNYPRFSRDGKYLYFRTKDTKGKFSTLNVLELGKNKPLQFENCIFDRAEKHQKNQSPDGKYLAFITENPQGKYPLLNILEFGKKKPLQFENCLRNLSEYLTGFSFGPNSKYLTFITKSDSKNITTNILELGKQKPLQFDNSKRKYYEYSLEGKYLTFFTNNFEDEYSYIINILELGKTKPLQFKDCTFFNSSSRFSFDNKYYYFTTKNESVDYSNPTINILELGKTKPFQFKNSESKSHFYTLDAKQFVFSTRKKGQNHLIINVLELERGEVKIFQDRIGFLMSLKRFSSDGRYYIHYTDTNKVKISPKKFTQNFWEISTDTIYKIRNQNKIAKLIYLKNGRFISISTNPLTKGNIYKIIDLSLGDTQQAFEYYKENIYTPLTKEEKTFYGIID